MKYNFDKEVCRKNTGSFKWDTLEEKFNNKDAIPMWVADMDFEVSKSIVDGIKNRLNHSVFGYGITSDSYFEAFILWMKNQHNYDIKKDWVVFSPGVIPGISRAIGAFTNKGDEIIVQSPVYHHFYSVIETNGCKVVDNPLVLKNGRYEMDFIDLENKITDKTKMIILCSPHNPVGRVWSFEELRQLGDICLKHNILVISDEIHSDIVYKGYKHTVFTTIDERFKDISIICTAPNKTFNIAGFQTANMVISNKELREKYNKFTENQFFYGHSILGNIAQEEAYKNGYEWYVQLLEYLEENKEYVIKFIENRLPQLKVVRPEGTYLLWIDFSNLSMSEEELSKFLIHKCGVILNEGNEFGKECGQYQRMNIATQRKKLTTVLEKMEREISKL
ncbi:pyridoxal phosphate-dependent aminotransferase [Terrisporobacter mayombei]|nr:pyridoxal phosphate-dependent aminotransferase [Terrisporobacter mayombei]